MVRRLFFVGYDPGTTSAVALVDLDGGVADSRVKRGMGESEIVRFVVDRGKPIAVCTDVARAPASVEKVAARLGVRVVRPEKTLSVVQKKRLSKYRDNHLRDAVAAARSARNMKAGKIRNLRRRYGKVDAGVLQRNSFLPAN